MIYPIRFLILALALSTAAFAQTGAITGKVTEADTTSTPIAGATVSLFAAPYRAAPDSMRTTYLEKRTQTDAKGEYTFERVPPDKYVLRVESVGYHHKERDVSVLADSTIHEDFELHLESINREGHETQTVPDSLQKQTQPKEK